MQQPHRVSMEMMKNATEIKCESCGHDTFEEVIKLRKISKLITGSSKDTLIPMPMFACKKCGNINKEFDITDLTL
ncbi:MAG: hypothetical protein HPY57_13520 [Ignavibacteria bacterium]|nr:hypothetical protein [Ignavibacteria bacterium]